ncbi:discoidin domain-containing protein [Candidatus Poribacteria bacterium]|nr:discoidin domain-containing protein [Candidatus Poribacteria bacterium]
MRPFFPLILPIFALTLIPSAFSLVELALEEPIGDFLTNNESVRVEGYITSSIEGDGMISVANSAGMRSPPHSDLPIAELVVDFLSKRNISQLRITSLFRDGLLFGPRKVMLRFSNDGEHFSAPVPRNVPSGVSSEDMASTIQFDPPISFRFVAIDMVESWQREGVEVKEISAIDADGNTRYGLIRSAGFSLVLSLHPARFAVDVPLMPGESRLTVSARLVNPPPNTPPSEIEDFVTVDVLRVERLPQPSEMKEPIRLSDGDRLSVVIPPGGVRDVERVEIIRLSPEDLPSSPILAYDFKALYRVPFLAKASAYLETQPPSLAVDGDMDPRSSWMTGITPMPVEITVDLRGNYRVGSLVIHPLIEDGKPYGPQRAQIFISSDGRNFTEILDYDSFNDGDTPVPLPRIVRARYVRIKILESKQPDDVRIREIQFLDETGTPIVHYIRAGMISFDRPVLIEVTLDRSLIDGRDVEKLALFSWDEVLGRWMIIGGELDETGRKLIAETNFLSRIALFQTENKGGMEPKWTLNPFSPNGDGVADVTRMTIRFPRRGNGEYGQLLVQIFDLSGKLVRTLVDRETMLSGSISVQWDGTDGSGRPVPIGPYLYQIKIGDRKYNGLIVVAR